jgi:inorganic pyrophosphatase
MSLYDLPAGPDAPRRLNAVVEIPRGSRNKYEYDPGLGLFRLDRVLYAAVHYPTAYGFIPGTLAGDGDPLDVLVTTTEPTFSGCLIVVRPVALLRLRDEKSVDDKVLSVPVQDPLYAGVESLQDLPHHHARGVEHFFLTYKELEGQQVTSLGWEGQQAAEEIVRQGIEAFRTTG